MTGLPQVQIIWACAVDGAERRGQESLLVALVRGLRAPFVGVGDALAVEGVGEVPTTILLLSRVGNDGDLLQVRHDYESLLLLLFGQLSDRLAEHMSVARGLGLLAPDMHELVSIGGVRTLEDAYVYLLIPALAHCRYFRLVSLFLSDNLHHILIAVLFRLSGKTAHRIHLVDGLSAVSVFFLAIHMGRIGIVQGARRRSRPLGLVIGGGPHRL